MPPGSRASTFIFPASKPALGVFEFERETYRRLPGTAKFENLDPEIDQYTQEQKENAGSSSGAVMSKYWTCPLYMLDDEFNRWKLDINNGTATKWPDPMLRDNKQIYFFEINGPYGHTMNRLSVDIWTWTQDYNIPLESKLVSASVSTQSLTGVNFAQTQTPLGSTIANTNTHNSDKNLLDQIGTQSTIITSPEERRMLGYMTSPNNSTSTQFLPQTVFISIPSSGSGFPNPILAVNLPPNTKPDNISIIKHQIKNALLQRGYTTSMISKFFRDNPQIAKNLIILPNSFGQPSNATTPGSGRGGGGNKNSGTTVSFGTTAQPDIAKKVTVRLGSSYTSPQNISSDDSRPLMIQWISNSPVRTATDFQNGNSIRAEDKIITDPATGRVIKWTTQQATLKYVFPYVPTDIQYSTLGAQWTEVPRAKNIPLVDFQGYQRMKVSFSFIISSTRTEPGGRIVPDGLYSSVDEQITLLRKMYQSKQPVTIYNMDSLLTNPANRLNNNPVQFVIADLAIEAVRRQEASPSRITTAQCSITLNEIVAENAVLINIRPPAFDEFIPTGGGGGGGGTPSRPDLWTKYLPQPISSVIPSNTQLQIEGAP